MKLFVSKVPKLLILVRILPFLDEDELNKFGSVCRVFRKLIYSPMGLKIVIYNRTRRMAEYFQDNIMSKAHYSVMSNANETDHFGSYKKDVDKVSQVDFSY